MSLTEWLIDGERGLSSNSIVKAATGHQVELHNWPRDPADLRRCLLLLEAAPEVRSGITALARAVPRWATLETHWAELEQLLRDEIGPELTVTPGLVAPLTYYRMQSLLYGDAA